MRFRAVGFKNNSSPCRIARARVLPQRRLCVRQRSCLFSCRGCCQQIYGYVFVVQLPNDIALFADPFNAACRRRAAPHSPQQLKQACAANSIATVRCAFVTDRVGLSADRVGLSAVRHDNLHERMTARLSELPAQSVCTAPRTHSRSHRTSHAIGPGTRLCASELS